jgi:hypothetical protein
VSLRATLRSLCPAIASLFVTVFAFAGDEAKPAARPLPPPPDDVKTAQPLPPPPLQQDARSTTVVAATSMEGMPPSREEELVTRSSLIGRTHTVAVLEAGILTLPTAPISQSNRGGNTPFGIGKQITNGDATPLISARMLYRAPRDSIFHAWAFGAGVTFAPRPTADSPIGNPPRTHSRSYFLIGGEARYMLPELRSRYFEGWFGGVLGGVVVGDRFDTQAGDPKPQILGTKEVTVRSEGLAVGVQVGGDWLIGENVVLGFALRASLWFLPEAKPAGQDPSCDALGDCPTLNGAVQAFDLGITIGYRIPL